MKSTVLKVLGLTAVMLLGIVSIIGSGGGGGGGGDRAPAYTQKDLEGI